MKRDMPILFSGPMVRAILEDRKHETRRVVRPQPVLEGGEWAWYPRKGYRVSWTAERPHCPTGNLSLPVDYAPYQVGDGLWVREAWRVTSEWDDLPPRLITPGVPWYEANGSPGSPAGRLRPGVFMPRWASRITLEVTAVRCERLQEITEEDAKAEGASLWVWVCTFGRDRAGRIDGTTARP